MDDAVEVGPAGAFACLSREVLVAAALLFAPDVTFAFEDVEKGADGGVGGWVGESGVDLGDSGAGVLEEDGHDLAFASAEVEVFGHGAAPFRARVLVGGGWPDH